MTQTEQKQLVKALRAKARARDKQGLYCTAQGWRDAAKYILGLPLDIFDVKV